MQNRNAMRRRKGRGPLVCCRRRATAVISEKIACRCCCLLSRSYFGRGLGSQSNTRSIVQGITRLSLPQSCHSLFQLFRDGNGSGKAFDTSFPIGRNSWLQRGGYWESYNFGLKLRRVLFVCGVNRFGAIFQPQSKPDRGGLERFGV